MDLNILVHENDKIISKKITSEFFIIDGSNIAYEVKNSEGKPMLSNILNLKHRLDKFRIVNYKIICDRSLFYSIDDQENYSKLISDGIIIESPGGLRKPISRLTKERSAF